VVASPEPLSWPVIVSDVSPDHSHQSGKRPCS
jgi:hypothetical protein